MNSNENRKWYLVIAIFAVIFTFFGGSLAYFQWQTSESQRTNIVLTIEQDFMCEADGGGDITNEEKYLVPTDCMNSTYAIQRIVTVTPTVYGELGVSMNLWLDIKNIGTGLSNSNNFKYALTTSPTSCTTGVVSSGNFRSKSTGGKVTLLNQKKYQSTTTDTYYLYIWLDKAETSTSTMNQPFNLSLGGECTNASSGQSGGTGGSGGNDIPNSPELATGMIPVKISNNGAVTTVSPSDPSWYSYENKQWANAVLVDNTVRGTYINEDGTINSELTVLEANILAYYVWIPKYSYKMNGTEKPISISFNSTPEGYIEHPAFDFDGDINGFWVGKFETGHSTLSSSTTSNNLACTDENCANADGLVIKPNVQSLRYNKVSNMFYASRSMERDKNPFGLDSSEVDTHMMKNSEWGAVAYLSHSVYGINQEIRINNNSGYTTGCGASAVNGGSSSSCQIAYGGVSDGTYPQSTTGNITGVYDMSGGAYEYVMGYYSGANSNYATNPDTYFGYTSSSNSAGFTSRPASKYWDEYTKDTSTLACNGGICYGHALSETAGWYSDSAGFVYASSPWFIRGGYYVSGDFAGAFHSSNVAGSAASGRGFRSVVIKGA